MCCFSTRIIQELGKSGKTTNTTKKLNGVQQSETFPVGKSIFITYKPLKTALLGDLKLLNYTISNELKPLLESMSHV